VNFDVPGVPEDYIHRVGRTARAEQTGAAFTFVAPEEEGDVSGIERAIGKRLPRVTLPDFDYKAAGAPKLEVPLAERIAAIRARKAEERARSRAKAERRVAGQGGRPFGSPQGRPAPPARSTSGPSGPPRAPSSNPPPRPPAAPGTRESSGPRHSRPWSGRRGR
jgi:ATP-dependent RNA helicase RhlE